MCNYVRRQYVSISVIPRVCLSYDMFDPEYVLHVQVLRSPGFLCIDSKPTWQHRSRYTLCKGSAKPTFVSYQSFGSPVVIFPHSCFIIGPNSLFKRQAVVVDKAAGTSALLNPIPTSRLSLRRCSDGSAVEFLVIVSGVCRV